MPPAAFLRLDGVMFAYDSATSPLFSGLELAFEPGWTGVVGRNGSGKTTLLRLAVGDLTPGLGRVERRGQAALCEQETSRPPVDAVKFLSATSPESYRLRGRLEVGTDWLERYETLSHGERKLLQIGAALFRQPAILVVDEPTNHLDEERRRQVRSALESFRGVGLIVSHDRDLLDALCSACLFLGGGLAAGQPRPPLSGSADVDRLADRRIRPAHGRVGAGRVAGSAPSQADRGGAFLLQFPAVAQAGLAGQAAQRVELSDAHRE